MEYYPNTKKSLRHSKSIIYDKSKTGRPLDLGYLHLCFLLVLLPSVLSKWRSIVNVISTIENLHPISPKWVKLSYFFWLNKYSSQLNRDRMNALDLQPVGIPQNCNQKYRIPCLLEWHRRWAYLWALHDSILGRC